MWSGAPLWWNVDCLNKVSRRISRKDVNTSCSIIKYTVAFIFCGQKHRSNQIISVQATPYFQFAVTSSNCGVEVKRNFCATIAHGYSLLGHLCRTWFHPRERYPHPKSIVFANDKLISHKNQIFEHGLCSTISALYKFCSYCSSFERTLLPLIPRIFPNSLKPIILKLMGVNYP